MEDTVTHGKKIVFVGMMLVASAVFSHCECGDSDLSNTFPQLGRYFVSPTLEVFPIQRFGTIPPSNVIDVDFGEVALQTTTHQYLFFRNEGDADLDLYPIDFADDFSPDFSISCVEEGETIQNCQHLDGSFIKAAPGRDLIIDIVYAPKEASADFGSFTASFNTKEHKDVTVNLTGHGVSSDLCVTPTEVDFGNVLVGSNQSKSFTITNCGSTNISITNLAFIQGSSNAFSLPSLPSFPYPLAPNANVAVSVQYQPAQARADAGNVGIYSNAATADPITHLTETVAVRGNAGAANCDVVATPSPADFGEVTVGEMKPITIIITNNGNSICTFNNATLTQTGSVFLIAQYPSPNTSFGPQQSLSVLVQYTPISAGQNQGTLNLFTSDSDTSEIHVSLAGTGKLAGNGPVAVCSVTPTLIHALNETLNWKGDTSYDTNNVPIITYNWTIVSFPNGAAATLNGTGSNRTTLPDMAGTYTAQLVVVNQNNQSSPPCTATATFSPSEDLWIEMFWTVPTDDMDLHLIAADLATAQAFVATNRDCYFENCTPRCCTGSPPGCPVINKCVDWGSAGYTDEDPHLDLDDTEGTGPENVNVLHPPNGTYTVFVHDFFYVGNECSDCLGNNTVTVNVYIRGTRQKSYQCNMTGEPQHSYGGWYVCTIDWPSGNIVDLPCTLVP
jgi:hypothetical protein